MKKMVTIKNFAAIVAASILLLGACKKPEAGPAGKDGAAGANGVVTTSTDGYIKGTVSGTRKDGVAFNEAFDYKNYYGGPSGIIDSVATNMYLFRITRGEDILGYNYGGINIMVSSKAATTGTLNIYFNFEKSLGSNKLFQFSTTSSATTAVSGLSYNATTGLYSGTFNCSVPGIDNTSGNLATISGSFQATMTQIYNKTVNTGAIIKD